MKLSALFDRCLHIDYIQVENSADYAVERIGSTLYLYFEASNGCADWKNNLDFPITAYRRRDGTRWFAHRGFLKIWETLFPYLEDNIMDRSVQRIVSIGYSHGAALALLCHEYVWFQRPELRDTIEGYGFGCPRVFWGCRTPLRMQRWERFFVIRNLNDIVTHLPPCIFGFSHVGNMLTVGERGKYSMIDAHRPENIRSELMEYEKTLAREASFSRWDTRMDPMLLKANSRA